jgi:hypothetical protein
MANKKGIDGGTVVALAVIAFFIFYASNGPAYFFGSGKTSIRRIASDKIFMDDGSVWTTDGLKSLPVTTGDTVRYQYDGDASGTTCTIADKTTGATFEATRVSAPFSRSSCPSGAP